MKKVNLQFLTYASLMTGLNVLFLILYLFVPFFSFILLIAIPLGSTFVAFKTNLKYFFLYLISSLLICSLIDFQETILYILPSLISGYLFGIFIKMKLHGYFIILLSSIINILLLSLSFFFTKLIFQTDLYDFLKDILSLDQIRFNNIILSILFALSLIQISVDYLFIESESKKLSFKIDEENNIFYPLFFINLSLLMASFLFYKLNLLSIANFLICINIYSAIHLIYYLYQNKHKIVKICASIIYILNIFINIYLLSIQCKIQFIFMIFSLSTIIIGAIMIAYQAIIKEKISKDIFQNIDE